MSKRSELPQSRRHVFIFDEDWDFLEQNYGASALIPSNRIGTSGAIKLILHRHIKLLRARQQEAADQRREHSGARPTRIEGEGEVA